MFKITTGPHSQAHYPANYQLYPMLGLKAGGHLPDEGFYKILNGTLFICTPKQTTPGRKSSKHRLFFACECGRHIPFGRAHQHLPHCKGITNTAQ